MSCSLLRGAARTYRVLTRPFAGKSCRGHADACQPGSAAPPRQPHPLAEPLCIFSISFATSGCVVMTCFVMTCTISSQDPADNLWSHFPPSSLQVMVFIFHLRIRDGNRYVRIFLSTAQRASIDMKPQLVRCGPGFCSEFFQVWRIGIAGFHDFIGTPDICFLDQEPLLFGANIHGTPRYARV
jgi:hypothetical protein